jgi:translocation and assembly module TamB
LNASLDLAALARQIPRTLRLREDLRLEKGSAQLAALVTGDAAKGKGGQKIQATAKLADLAANLKGRTLSFRDPATVEARLHREGDVFALEQLDVQTPFLTATGRGDLDRGISVSASVDLKAATERLSDWFELGGVALAGRGQFDARYQRIVKRYEASAKAELTGLSATGMPVVETIQRDRIAATMKATGGATASGFPSSLHEFSLMSDGDAESLKLTALLDQASGVLAASAQGRTGLVVAGKKQSLEGVLKTRWGAKEVSIDQLALTLAPVVGPGGQFLPSDPARWSGQGRYDIEKDELAIDADPLAPGAGATALSISPTQIRAGGLKSKGAAWFETKLLGDLARLSTQAKSHTPLLLGQLTALAQGRQNSEGWDLGARVRLTDLSLGASKESQPVVADQSSLSIRASYLKKLDRVDVAELAVITPYGRIEGAGPISEIASAPRLDLKGTLSPDWRVLTDLLKRKVEPNASVSGTPRAWQLSGTIPRSESKDVMTALNGEVGVNLEQVDVFGMRLGRSSVVVRAKDGHFRIDPIDSTLNAGRLHLEPEVIQDKQGIAWLRMGSNSGLFDAVVNDEVSHRVLSFAAPVLDQATRVRGRISLALNEAYFPLGAGADAQAKVDGDVLFDAVEFMPGPLADQIIGVFRQERRPLLVLRDPISIRILGRKVYQEGLILPLGNIAAIGLEGWVDFDQNLDMVASFAMIPPRRNIPVLSQILENTQIQVPITGTFKKPRINGEAIKDRFKDMGTNLLETMMDVGANGLNRILRGGQGGPVGRRDFFPPFPPPADDRTPPPPQPGSGRPAGDRTGGSAVAERNGNNSDSGKPVPDRKARERTSDPDAEVARLPSKPEPLTAEDRRLLREQRRARRLEKKAERRLNRGLPPQ